MTSFHQARSSGRNIGTRLPPQALRELTDHLGNIEDRSDDFDRDNVVRKGISGFQRHLFRHKIEPDAVSDHFDSANSLDIELWNRNRLDQSGRRNDPRTHGNPPDLSGDLSAAFGQNYSAIHAFHPASILTPHGIVNRLHLVSCSRKLQPDTFFMSERAQ